HPEPNGEMMIRDVSTWSGRRATAALAVTMLLALQGCATAAGGGVGQPRASGGADARIGLRAGWNDAASAIHNLELIAHAPRPEGFGNPRDMNDFGFANTDIAFQGELAFLGNYNGFQVWDISTPEEPRLRS